MESSPPRSSSLKKARVRATASSWACGPILDRFGAIFARAGFAVLQRLRRKRALACEQIIDDAPDRQPVPMFERHDARSEPAQAIESHRCANREIGACHQIEREPPIAAQAARFPAPTPSAAALPRLPPRRAGRLLCAIRQYAPRYHAPHMRKPALRRCHVTLRPRHDKVWSPAPVRHRRARWQETTAPAAAAIPRCRHTCRICTFASTR